jgi:hypothetical protein
VTPECRRTREISAELALGIAEGQQRAEALEHLATCAACRSEVDHLAAAADSVLLTAPTAEPPAGFETTVLSRLDRPVRPPSTHPRTRPRRRPSRRRVVVVAAVAATVVLVFVAGLGAGRVLGDRAGGDGPRDEVAMGAFTAESGAPIGEVRAISGEPSWLFVTLTGSDTATPLEAGDYQVECVYRSGYSYIAGTLTIDPDDPAARWSTAVEHRLDGLDQVRLIGADGTTVVATLDQSN